MLSSWGRGIIAMGSLLLVFLLLTSAYEYIRVLKRSQMPRQVHVVFGNHLDVGYGGILGVAFDNNVVNTYFHNHFPRAIRLAEEMRNASMSDRFVYTTHSWLVSMFLSCPPGIGILCPDADQVEAFKDAIKRGDITWHAFPFNGQAEIYDAPMYAALLQIAHDLDDMFGIPHKTAMSQRDVPGLTRGAIPILAASGIVMVSVGVNSASAPPAVPHGRPFIWRDPITGSEIIAMWHPGGYGGRLGEIYVDDGAHDCIVHPSSDHILCVAWRDDNQGPPLSTYEIGGVFMHLRDKFPGASVVASTFDQYAQALMVEKSSLNLEVFTGEIGDTWVYGTGSDPLKVAEFRAAMRGRKSCLGAGICSEDDPALRNFTRLLGKVGEHTWGLAIQVMNDWDHWSNEDLAAKLRANTTGFELMVQSWERQASYVQWALEALPAGHYIRSYVEAERAARFVPGPPVMDQMMGAHSLRVGIGAEDLHVKTTNIQFKIDMQQGVISSLVFNPGNTPQVDWCDRLGGLGRLRYSTYTENTFLDVLAHQYSYATPLWVEDFGKRNCDAGNPRRAEIQAKLKAAWQLTTQESSQVYLQFTFEPWAVSLAGAPQSAWVLITAGSDASHLDLEVIWINKTATRLPEALWFQFQPGQAAVDVASWKMDKLGSKISPLEVVLNGSMSQHHVGEQGVSVLSGKSTLRGSRAARLNPLELRISSPDAGLVSPGTPWALPNPSNPPDMSEGVSWNLFNNAWGTNYVMWMPYAERHNNMKFRFRLEAVSTAPIRDTTGFGDVHDGFWN